MEEEILLRKPCDAVGDSDIAAQDIIDRIASCSRSPEVIPLKQSFWNGTKGKRKFWWIDYIGTKLRFQCSRW